MVVAEVPPDFRIKCDYKLAVIAGEVKCRCLDIASKGGFTDLHLPSARIHPVTDPSGNLRVIVQVTCDSGTAAVRDGGEILAQDYGLRVQPENTEQNGQQK